MFNCKLFLSILMIVTLSESSCDVSDSCKNKCMGRKIDLGEIVKPGTVINATARDGNEFSFVFNLCGGADCGVAPDSVSAAVCQWRLDHSRGFNLGGPSEVTWSGSNTTHPFTFNVTYSGVTPGDGTVRAAHIQFIDSDNKDPLIVFNEEIDDREAHTFYFTVTAKIHHWPHVHVDPIICALITIAVFSLIIFVITIILLVYYIMRRKLKARSKDGHNYKKLTSHTTK